MLFTIYFLIFEAFPLSNDHDLTTSKDCKRNLLVITSKNSSENNNFRYFEEDKTTDHEKNIKADPERSPTMSPEPTPILDYSNKAYFGLKQTINIDDSYLNTEINNTEFINYDLSSTENKDYLFYVEKEFRFENVKFIFNETGKQRYGAIKITGKNLVDIINCQFIGCLVEGGTGGNAIYFTSPPQSSSSSNEIDDNFRTIKNCLFKDCGRYSSSNSGFVIIFDDEYKYDVSGLIFNDNNGGIKISEGVKYANVESCTFLDCTKTAGGEMSVVVLNNKNCRFVNNEVKFSSDKDPTTSICGLFIQHHGNIDVLSNHFYRIKNTIRGGLTIEDQEKDDEEGIVSINYNIIEDCCDSKMGTFSINKIYDFNFDHNTIKNCIIKGYSCQIVLSNNVKYSNEYTLTNLTLIGCESNSKTGGGFGIWLVFNITGTAFNDYEVKHGKFTLQDCLFENNHAGYENSETYGKVGGSGGGFQCGNSSNAWTDITIINCTFRDNRGELYGGALDISSSEYVIIENNTFINNSCKLGGGAIRIAPYVYKHYDSTGILPLYSLPHMKECTISNCTFIGNKDSRGYGHVIYFEHYYYLETEFIIKDNCQFIDNGDLQNNNFKGYTIVSAASTFQFKDSTISFTNIELSTAGLKLEGSGSSQLTNIKFIQTNNAHWTYTNLDYEGLAIVIKPTTSSVEIDSCIFDHCGTWSGKSAIYDEGTYTEINNCQFLNDDHGDNRVGAVYINSIGIHIITNIYAQNCCADHGTFQYKPETQTTASQRIFTFRNVTIDKVFGIDRMALNFNLRNADQLDIEDVTIMNTDHKSDIVGLDLDDDLSEFTFTKFNFTNNEVQENYMGGSGIWVQAYNNQEIKFVDCTFIGNHAEFNNDNTHLSGYGGAWSVGKSTDIKDISVTMTRCRFDANHADKCGGALCILSTNKVTIEDCIFNGNYANDNGGAIYLDSEHQGCPDQFIILGCSFTNNHATYDSTLYFQETSENTLIDVSDCIFTENVANMEIVYSTAKHLIVHDLKFEFSDTNSNARPLCLGRRSKTEVYNAQFIRCSMNNDEGTAIKGEEGIGNLNVYDSKFQDCKDVGSSVYLLGSPIYFSNVEFLCTSEAKASGLNIQNCGNHIEVIDCSFTNMKSRTNGQISPLCLFSNGEDEDFIFTGLTFTNCYGSTFRCFSLSAYKPFIFSNITVKDNILGYYLGQINLNGRATSTDVFLFDNCKWYRNKCNTNYGGGAGLWLNNNRQACAFTFQDCIFEGNSNTIIGGAFQDGGSYSLINKILQFINCTFNDNIAPSGGALAIEITLPFSIDGCTFTNNNAQGDVISTNGGGAIYINTNGAISCSITNCNFVSNQATTGYGTVIFVIGPLITMEFDGSNTVTNRGERGSVIASSSGNLQINNVVFNYIPLNDQSTKNFRAAHLLPQSSTTFTSCRFIGTGFTSNSPGTHAILAERNTTKLTFDQCIFQDCGYHADQYAIESTAETFEFISSQITYTTPTANTACCGSISIKTHCTLTVVNSLFKDILAKNQFAAGIYYSNSYNSRDILDFHVEITGTTFDNLGGKNGRAGFLKLAKSMTFSNCTVKNMPDGNYILVIGHDSINLGPANLDRIKFIDNKANCIDGAGGGIGLWISQTNKCIFNNCEFIRNTNTGNYHGGALGYSQDQRQSTSRVGLEFTGCFFQDNKVQSGFHGGSLYINAQFKAVEIDNCEFSNTIADVSTKGGAIYIAGETTQDITITNTQFRNMKVSATSNDSGNGIFIENGAQNVIIEDCKFIDCGGTGSSVCTGGCNVMLQRTTVTFTETPNNCKGIYVMNECHIELNDSVISNCKSTSDGGGFSYRKTTHNIDESSFTENLVFRNTIIDNCEANNGRALFATVTSPNTEFFNLTIQNIKSNDGFIFILGHSPKIQESVKFEQCNFLNCQTNINNNDGGGLGFWCSDEKGIEFNDCTFRNLIAGTNGGAISFTQSDPRRNTFVTFSRCLFDSNEAGRDGSALYIDISAPLLITQCNFTYNIGNGNQNGGAIFITERCRNINIERTEFYSNAQSTQSQSNGNAIYFEKQQELIGRIYDCKFVDNGNKGSVIYTDGVDLEFFLNTIIFTQQDVGAQGLHVAKSCCIHIANSTFKGCVSSSDGAGFIYDGRNNKSDHVLVTLESSIFENNKAKNGCVIINAQMYSITNCKFINCQAENGGGLYIENEDLLQDNADDSIKSLVIENCIFDNCASTNDGGGIFLRIQMQSFNDISIISCIFNSCKCNNNNQCFDIAVSNVITFKNNTIKNMISSGNSYFGQIKNSSDITSYLHEIVIDEITFINNVCNSLFGGGSGLMILSEKIVFNECKFIKNTAAQMINSNDEQRPQPDGTDSVYYNGDGGGIQIGYSSSTSNTELEFTRCNFTDNKATRHGGAVAIQTLKTVIIFDCVFESNTADNRETSLSLLSYENHFDKKKEGRGGAIYINPTFSFHEGEEIYPSNNNHMKSIDIKNCTFIMNQAFDGFAIYIEGDEPENNFEISIHDNLFINNKQINGEYDINQTCRALIASEISFNFSKTINENIFNPSTNISLVDHYGNLIHFDEIESNYEFTPTKFFTTSNEFTSTKLFTISNEFTNSETLPNNIVNLPATKPQASRKITYSKSYSLTYVNQRSVSFSLSFVSSNVYEMSYDFIKGTYSMFASQTNYQSYFSYIIYYMSPLYVEQTIIIDITPRRKISPEQLIGVVCGSASVFFLVLGIIILAVRKHNEIKNQYDEFDDISYSSEAEIREINKNANETNINDCQETNGINENNLNEFI